MRVVGTNFSANPVILWNGNKLATSIVDASTLSGSIQGGSIAVPGTAQVQVQDSQTGLSSQAVPISIVSSDTSVPANLAISVPATPTAVVGTSYSVSPVANGGTPAYTWSLASGNLPAGMSLAANTGKISGTPTTAGTYKFTVNVMDSSSPVQTQSASLSIKVSNPTPIVTPLTIATSGLAAGTGAVAYSQSLQATGGAPAYTWAITSGTLPAGLTLVAASGVISGVPTTSGTFAFTATVTDASSPVQTKSAELSIKVAASSLTLMTVSLPVASEGAAYSQKLLATGGTPAYSWSITKGSLPTGLTLSAASGVISGTPTVSGSYVFTTTVTDSGNPVQTKSVVLSITIAAKQLTIDTSSLAAASEGAKYSQTLLATGGTPAYSWSITQGSLPTGLTLSAASGVISGAPTTSGTFAFTATVKDSSSPVLTKSVALSISVTGTPLTLTTFSLPVASEGAAYSQKLLATGGTPAYSWSITKGSLPTGLTLSAASGVISGTPTVSGSYVFTTTVTDSSSPAQTKSVVLSITIAAKQLTVATSSLAAASEGAAYSQTLLATGGTPAYSWSITSGSLPTGLTLSAASGVISGKATASGASSFTVSVSDSGSPVQTKSATLSITVSGSTVTITSSTLAAATVSTAYSQTLAANGGTQPYTWSISSGSLPAGLTLASAGVITGTPTASGTYSMTIKVIDSSSPAHTASVATSIVVAAETAAGPGTTWFVRPDGGTRFSANVITGQCNGKYDAAYPGTGVDQNCAFNDVRYLWSDNSGAQNAWVIAGGDTAVIRGCTALSSQTNASNPDCRLGYDNATSGNAPNYWCGYGVSNNVCFNPPIPAGTAEQPTRILGGCAYGTYSCTPINNKYPYGPTNETQLFGGFGLTWTFNLESTSHVTIEGIELTTHNGVCTSAGSPSYPRGCSSGAPYDDFAGNGFLFNTSSSNITLQDVYIHGFNSSGLYGPIGGPIALTRVFSGFNAFAGWNFDDGSGTQDATGSGITASYVTMMFNGCYEQYPITATYPAQVCYDTNSGGFGDSWSGQGVGTESVLTSFTCDYCVDIYNTKDGFIGPHIAIPTLTITNSVAIGNMGANWKWGGEDGVVNTTTFENNLTVSNCSRMSQPMKGVPSTYNKYLTGFCRAGGNGIASIMPKGSTWNMRNNTFITAQQIAWYVACAAPDVTCPSTINSTNNVFLGFTDPNNPYGANVPTLYYLDTGIVLNVSHNDEFGMKLGSCPSTANGMICVDPLLQSEPAQTWNGAEADLDVFNPFVAGNSFYPASNSPLLGEGLQITGLTTDYYGVTRPDPPTMGGVEYVAP